MNEKTDPCAEYGWNQRTAIVWFFSVLFLGLALGFVLMSIDRGFYDSKGYVLKFEDHQENRVASSSLASERQDERTQSSF